MVHFACIQSALKKQFLQVDIDSFSIFVLLIECLQLFKLYLQIGNHFILIFVFVQLFSNIILESICGNRGRDFMTSGWLIHGAEVYWIALVFANAPFCTVCTFWLHGENILVIDGIRTCVSQFWNILLHYKSLTFNFGNGCNGSIVIGPTICNVKLWVDPTPRYIDVWSVLCSSWLLNGMQALLPIKLPWQINSSLWWPCQKIFGHHEVAFGWLWPIVRIIRIENQRLSGAIALFADHLLREVI